MGQPLQHFYSLLLRQNALPEPMVTILTTALPALLHWSIATYSEEMTILTTALPVSLNSRIATCTGELTILTTVLPVAIN